MRSRMLGLLIVGLLGGACFLSGCARTEVPPPPPAQKQEDLMKKYDKGKKA